MKRVATALFGSILAGGMAVVGAPAANATNSHPDGTYCKPAYHRTYKQTSWAWYHSDGGTIKNPSKATVKQSFTYSFSASLGVSGEATLGISASAMVAEINAQSSFTVSVSTKISKSETFSVSVPPHTNVTYRTGIIKRTLSVKYVQTFSNCNTRTTTSTATVGDRYAIVKNI